MNSYRYRAISANGMIQQGIVEAIDEKSAVRQLRDQGMLPVEIALDAKAWRFRRLLSIEFVWRRGLGAEALAEATHEIATMLKAGQDLDRALRYVVDTANQRAVRDCFDDVRQFVRNGATLASGLERHPSSFPPLYIAVVRAGEAGGRIAESLDRLALLLEQERAMAAAIRAALIYPAMLTVAAVLAISVILTEVLPQFVPLFAEAGATLPASTRILLIVGDFVSSYGLLLLLGLLCLIATVRAAQQIDGSTSGLSSSTRSHSLRLLPLRFLLRRLGHALGLVYATPPASTTLPLARLARAAFRVPRRAATADMATFYLACFSGSG